MFNAKEMDDEELKSEYKQLFDSIYVFECYGISDLKYFGELERELERRNILINQYARFR